MVDSEFRVFPIMPQDNRGAIAASDIDPAGCTDGRRKDKVPNTRQPQRLAERLAGGRVKPGKNILIMSQHIEGVVIKQRRRYVRRQAIEFPYDMVGAGEVAFGPGESDSQHGLRIVTVP